MTTFLCAFLALVLLVLVVVAGYFYEKRKPKDCDTPTHGTLKIDTSDPDGPYLFLEISNEDLDYIRTQSYVTLRVDTSGYLPQD